MQKVTQEETIIENKVKSYFLLLICSFTNFSQLNVNFARKIDNYFLSLLTFFILFSLSANGWANQVALVSCADNHSAAIKSDGTLWTWGDNYEGQLGDGGPRGKRVIPAKIASTAKWHSIAGGNDYMVAIKSDGTLWEWGDVSSDDGKKGPVKIGSAVDWKIIAAGVKHNLAVKADGTLWSWGIRDDGNVGDSTWGGGRIKLPKQIAGATRWKAIAAGNNHSLGIKVNGTLWSWGVNTQGQLGNGSDSRRDRRNTPEQIGTDTNWELVSAGSGHSLAIKSDGTLWAWGYNKRGQLGDGTHTNKAQPVKIGFGSDWLFISAGDWQSFAIKSDGTLWAWGDNDNGQLGDGTKIHRNRPVQIGTSTRWKSVASGDNHTIGIKQDGTVWGWGYNYQGQLGCVTEGKDTSSPIQIEF